MMMAKRDRPPKPVIAYVRVSTREQGKSGLGLEAQQEPLQRFAKQEVFQIVETFVEVASAKETLLAQLCNASVAPPASRLDSRPARLRVLSRTQGKARCVYRKSDSAILVMKTAKDRSRCDDAEALNRARERGIFVQRAMNS
jgi:Resolvase, N terminal domain